MQYLPGNAAKLSSPAPRPTSILCIHFELGSNQTWISVALVQHRVVGGNSQATRGGRAGKGGII